MQGYYVDDEFSSVKYDEVTVDLNDYLLESNIVGIKDVDTRALVMHIRENGAQNAIISSEITDVDKLNERLFFNEYVKLNTYFYGTPYANPNNPMLTFDPEKALKLLIPL